MEETFEHHLVPEEYYSEIGINDGGNKKGSKKKNKKESTEIVEPLDEEIESEDDNIDGEVGELVEQDISLVSGADYKNIAISNEFELQNNNKSSSSSHPPSTSIPIQPTSTSSESILMQESTSSSPSKIMYKGMEFVEDDEYQGKELVIIKANTGSFTLLWLLLYLYSYCELIIDLALCTFFDALDEIKERLEELKEEQEAIANKSKKSNKSKDKDSKKGDNESYERHRAELELLEYYSKEKNIDTIKLREVVRGGIGSVTTADVMIAESTKG